MVLDQESRDFKEQCRVFQRLVFSTKYRVQLLHHMANLQMRRAFFYVCEQGKGIYAVDVRVTQDILMAYLSDVFRGTFVFAPYLVLEDKGLPSFADVPKHNLEDKLTIEQVTESLEIGKLIVNEQQRRRKVGLPPLAPARRVCSHPSIYQWNNGGMGGTDVALEGLARVRPMTSRRGGRCFC